MIEYRKITLMVPADCSRQVLVPARCETVVVCFENRAMGFCGGVAVGFSNSFRNSVAHAAGSSTAGAVGDRLTPPDVYYTSLQYPIEVMDEIDVPMITKGNGNLYGIPDDEVGIAFPSLDPGTLEVVIRYITYSEWREEIQMSMPVFSPGTLELSARYVSVENTDQIDMPFPVFSPGTLVVVIAYINYTNWLAESIDIGLPTFGSGTLV